MKLLSEYTNATFQYDSKEERDSHVEKMESEGWECSGQIKETVSFQSNEWYWCGKFTRYTKV
jgi:hypothetical protein